MFKEAKRTKCNEIPFVVEWSLLPTEILTLILSSTRQCPADVLACRLACRAWFEVCEHPIFWSRVVVTVTDRQCSPHLWDFLARHDIKRIISNIQNPELLEQLFSTVSSLDTFGTESYEKCSKLILNAILKKGSKLSSVQHLVLKCRKTTRGGSASKMTERDMLSTVCALESLKTLHLECFHRLSFEKRSTNDNICRVTLHKCSTIDLLAVLQSFNQLQELRITQCTVTAKDLQDRDQVHEANSPSLHTLRISHSQLKTKLLPEYDGLKHLDLSFCHLDEDHLDGILSSIKDTSLTHLNLSCNSCVGKHVKQLQNKFSKAGGRLVVKQCYGLKESMLQWLRGHNPQLSIVQ
jgi:hypothetical protein